MKRTFDIIVAILALIILLPIFIIIIIMMKFKVKGPTIHWSKRVGLKNKIFLMPKIRTMIINTPQIDTNSLIEPQKYILPIGTFLRKTSLDEIPQFYSVLMGDMSVVGPRPALFNQYDLIELRKKNMIDQLLPGITGLAQINGRDSIDIHEKVNLELIYLNKKSLTYDIKIVLQTLFKFLNIKKIKH